MSQEAVSGAANEGAAPGVVIPPVVYVPVESVPQGQEVEIIFRRTRDGETALVLYTALDRLVDCCGPHQPWVLLPTERLVDVEQVQPFDLVLLDLDMPEEERVGPAGARA